MRIDIDYKNGIKSLLKQYEDVVNKKIKEGIEWRSKIETGNLSDKDQQRLLKDIVAQLLVQGRNAKGIETQISSIGRVIGEWKIENIERKLDSIGMSGRKNKN